MFISLKALKWTRDSYSRRNDLKSMEWNPMEGGHLGIPYQPTRGTQQCWIMWKNSNEQYVHGTVTVTGMTDMKSQDN